MDQNRLTVNKAETPTSFRRQGSIRKVLHSSENDPIFGVSARMLDRANKPDSLSSSSLLSCVQALQEYCIIAEYNMLLDNLVPSVYLIPAAKSPLLWFGVIFVTSGPYQGGVFRFNLLIPETFPSSFPPRVIFESDMFHPHIDSDSKELDLKPGFPEWIKGTNHIYQVVQYIKNIFVDIRQKNPVNKVATDLYDLNKDDFIKKCEECANTSVDYLFRPPTCDDPHYIKFSNYDEAIHSEAKALLTSPPVEEDDTTEARTSGFSWVKKGSLETFSLPLLAET